MQALSDEQQMERLERKLDDGFHRLERKIDNGDGELRAEILAARSEARADLRLMLSVTFGMWTATALAVVAILFSQS